MRPLKKKVIVKINSKEYLFSNDIIFNHFLYINKDISQKELDDICYEESFNKLYNFSLSLFNKKNYSEKEMKDYLTRIEKNKGIILSVINKLKKNNLINDLKYAHELKEYLNSSYFSQKKIKEKLRMKGISNSIIENIEFDEKFEKEKAIFLIKKLDKKFDKFNETIKKKKIINKLLFEGFPSTFFSLVDKNINKDDEYLILQKLDRDFILAKKHLLKKFSQKDLKNKLVIYLKGKGYSLCDILKKVENEKL